MNNDDNKATGAGELYPHCPGWFEDWLYEHIEQQDAVGEVARFVIRDYEAGCWPDTMFLDGYWVREYERQRREWVRHLILHHDWTGKACAAFERVHKEYAATFERSCAGLGWPSDGEETFIPVQIGKLDPATERKDKRPYWEKSAAARGDKSPDLWDYRHFYTPEQREKLRRELGR